MENPKSVFDLFDHDDNFSFINDSINTYNVIHNDTLGDLINPTTVSFVIPNNLNGINYTTNAWVLSRGFRLKL